MGAKNGKGCTTYLPREGFETSTWINVWLSNTPSCTTYLPREGFETRSNPLCVMSLILLYNISSPRGDKKGKLFIKVSLFMCSLILFELSLKFFCSFGYFIKGDAVFLRYIFRVAFAVGFGAADLETAFAFVHSRNECIDFFIIA